jgi:hypothetical protein
MVRRFLRWFGQWKYRWVLPVTVLVAWAFVHGVRVWLFNNTCSGYVTDDVTYIARDVDEIATTPTLRIDLWSRLWEVTYFPEGVPGPAIRRHKGNYQSLLSCHFGEIDGMHYLICPGREREEVHVWLEGTIINFYFSTAVPQF